MSLPSSCRRAWLLVAAFLLTTAAFQVSPPAFADRVEPGGAPPAGSGPIDLSGFVRVIDGQTIEAYLKGKRVGISLSGLEAPRGNTECGREATARLRALVKNGLKLEDDPSLAIDARGLRTYLARSRAGEEVAEALIKAGLARPDGRGKRQQKLADAESEARGASRGCVWRGHRASETTGPDFAALSFTDPALAEAPPEGSLMNMAAAPASSTLPQGFNQTVLTSRLTNPTDLVILSGGRILIAEKDGIVRVYKEGELLSTPFIDIRDWVNDYWDRGLIGIAADRGFTDNGFVYLLYAHENDAAQYSGKKTARLTRVTASGDTASLSSAVTILGSKVGSTCADFPAGSDCLPADWYGHGGGGIKFDSDGSLFVSLGDASNWNVVDENALRAQSLDSLAGKILRITPLGEGLPTNPFWNGQADHARSKIWASGLRNPFRFTIRSGSNLPYTGDVGWSRSEEVNVASRGANLGWPCYEGPDRQSGFEAKPVCASLYAQETSTLKAPLLTYPHSGSAAAVAGAVFYTGSAFPAEYRGALFYSDYVKGFLRFARVDDDNRLASEPAEFGQLNDGPVDIEVGSDGSLYYLAVNTGQLRRISYGGASTQASSGYLSDMAWTAMANGLGPAELDRSNGSQASGDGRALTLDGTTFSKGLGTHAPSSLKYSLAAGCSAFTARIGVDDEVGEHGSVEFQVWADGSKLYDSGLITGTAAVRSVDVDLTGKTELTLTVTDGGDGITDDHADWSDAYLSCGGDGANRRPTPTITLPEPAVLVKVGDVVSYTGAAIDPEDGPVDPNELSWSVTLFHCSGGACHSHPLTSGRGASGSFTVPDHTGEIYFKLVLTAIDKAGQSGVATLDIQTRKVKLTLDSSPVGRQIVYGGDSGVAPMVIPATVGSTHTIYAPSPQDGYTFTSWSDGAAQQHDVTVGETDATFRATFSGSDASSLFGPARSSSAGTNAHGVAAEDLNDDGKTDLIAANAGSNSVSVLMGNGDGTFKGQATYNVKAPETGCRG